ncbi:hypothetical protein [Thioalkalivibrio sp. XN8]|uniref:hypothetical protein n=1 Tax=Thioalkalivibrio sp. XN8 TaxID=2712863 RepID=UPI0013EB4D03|nr:hypothetical protein [Thioalkalivibrio sp. XN8]NGP53774.1 hypothetical protein [Thioalkalivibrio sp. XN8]
MSEAGAREIGFLQLLDDSWNLLLLALRTSLPLLVIALVGLVAWALLSRQPWPFSIEAQSEHATLLLTPELETNWRIDGALLCIRAGESSASAGLDELPAPEADSPCPGRRWRAFDLRGLSEATLRLPAMPRIEAAYSVRLDVGDDGSLALQVSGEGDGLAPLELLPGGAAAPLELGHAAILHFPPPGADHPPRRILLPFAGAGSIGKDVSWREPTLLRGGTVSLYTRSDEAAGGRDLVTTAALLPGDRVDLGQRSRAGGSATKGFVHFDLLPAPTEPAAMTVVALGEADAVQIVRFGDQGYSFSPGLLARLTRHSAVSTWAVLLVSLLGFMSIYKDGAELGQGSFRERRRRLAADWRRWRGGQGDADA